MDGSGHRVPLGIVCLTVLLLIGHVQTEGVCRTGCKGAGHQTFKYAVGTTYKYTYNGKIQISLSSAEGQTTGTELQADVLLTQLPNCDQLLRLQNVHITGSNGKKFGPIPDIQKAIRINNNDGVVEDSICVEDGDNQNSINVKRAIASLFQAASKPGYETDVFGTCPTELSSHKEGNILVIRKSKSLNKCSYREHIQQDFLSTALNLNSEIKSSPLLSGDYSATLKVKNGVLDQATVTEDYLYVPFSVGRNGAKAQITAKLQFTGTSKDSPQAPVTKPRSIIFDNPHPVVAPTSNLQVILTAVREVAKTIDAVVGETTAKEFLNLLKIVKVSNKNDLLSAYNQVKSGVGVGDKDAARRLYVDALLRAGNGESVEALLELLDKKQLDDIDTKLVLLGLNVVRHATEGSLKAVTHLLDSSELPREAYLGIGNLAGRFCQQHTCDNSAEFKALAAKLLTKIGAKLVNKNQENDAVYALKALANSKHLTDNVVAKIIALAQNKVLPSRIRAAALDSYLADACKDKLRNSALQILQDIQQDSEVRIRAYLVVAQCPNAKIGNAVKSLLTKEPSIQVGGFITSHIRAVHASANPDKALAKQFLGFSVRKSFPIDPRKYSFNGEFSYAIDTLGLAAATEANVIYSQNSWLPRATSLNLTAEVFGHTFNFLEIETRQENLDKLVEHYFGRQGVLRRSVLPEFVKEGKSTVHKLAEYLEQKLKSTLHRNRRDVTKAEIEHIAKQIQIKTNELNKDLDVDVSLKAFGSEIFFLNINQESRIKPEAIIDGLIMRFSEGLDKLQKFDETFRHNLNFLNAEVDYPTSLGFPLRLAVEGSANIQVQAEGNVDLRQIINNPERGDLRVKLIPSVNVEVNGRLTLDAQIVENGLKVVSTLYSSTGGDLHATWDKASGFEVKFGLPVQEQKLISANHEIVFLTREQAGRESNLPLKFTQVKDFSICLDQLSPFIGLTFCAEVNGPNLEGNQIPVLPFPLAGDAKVAVTIENDDVSEFRIKHSYKGAHADFALETIGKNGQKKVVLDLNAEYSPEKYITAKFTSPGKTALAEARIVSTNVEKSLLVKLALDKEEYVGKAGVLISGTPEHAVYKPVLEYKTPAGQQPLPISTEGQITVQRNGQNEKYIFENLKISDSRRQVSLAGNLGKDNGVYFADLSLSNGVQNIGLEGRLQLQSDLFKFNVKAQNNVNKNANFNLKGEFKKQPSHYDAALQLIHGPDLNSKNSILTVTSSWVNKFKSHSEFRFETKNSFSYPLLGVSGKLELEQTPKSLDYEINAQYGDLKLGSELEAKINEKTPGDYEIEFDLWGLDNKLEVKSKRQVLPNDESKISNTIELNNKKIELEGKVKHSVRPHNIDVGTELTLHISSHATPIKVSLFLKVNQDEIDAYNKITSGSDPIIDAFLKSDRKGNANGNVKIKTKNLAVNGQIHATNGVGTGDILVDVQGGKRQIKADTAFTLQPGHAYDLTLNIYPSYHKEKNVKIHLETKNKLSESSLESRNKVDLVGYPLEVNVKASRSGDQRTGKLDGELEVTLPGDKYFLTRGSCDHKHENDLASAQIQGSLEYRENKNSPGRKVGVKVSIRNSNLKEGLVDADVSLAAEDGNGKNINADIAVKSSNQDGQRQLNIVNKFYGSVLSKPCEVSLTSNCHKGRTGEFELRSSYGPSNTIVIKGSHDSSGETKKGSLSVVAATESEHLKSLNVDLTTSFVDFKSATPFHAEGHFNVQAVNSQGSLVDLKSKGNLKLSPLSGEVKGDIALNKVDPISVDASYTIKENKQGLTGAASVSYGKGQTVKGDIALDKSADHHYKIEAGLQTPIEGYKDSKLRIDTKRSKDNKETSSSVDLIVDGKSWKVTSQLELSDLEPLIDFKITGPEGKLQQFYAKGGKVSDKHFSGELKVVNEEKSFIFDGSITVNAERIENLLVKGQLHSPTLNLNKIVFDVHAKGETNDHKIQITVKTAGKNYISGTWSYSAKEESGKFIIDGSGSLKVKDESKTGHFKYIFEKLELAKDQEQGIQVSFDSTLGDKAVDSEFKITNKHFRVQHSYCEQKKECAYMEIDNKVTTNDAETFNQVLEINLDLRKLGLSHEFGLKTVTNRQGWVIDHTVDAHFQNQDNSKYQYTFYIHSNEAGSRLTTPKRIVALEGKFVPLKNFKEGGKTNGELVFYLDKKNHANKKAALTWSVEVDPKGKLNGEWKFAHPGLRKPLSASFRATRDGTPFNGRLTFVGELDVFAQDNQKLVVNFNKQTTLDLEAKTKGTYLINFSAKSTGLGIDMHSTENISGDRIKREFNYDLKWHLQAGKTKYENELSSKWSPNEISGVIKVLNRVLLNIVNKIQITDTDKIIETEVSSYDNQPLVNRLEIKNYNTLAYSVWTKSDPNEKILINVGFIPGQVADIRADRQIGSNKVSLLYGTVKLDDANFLKSEHKVDSTAIQELLKTFKERSVTYLTGLEAVGKEWADTAKRDGHELGELTKKAIPNLQPLKQYYTKELEEIKEEILNDKSINAFGEVVRQTIGATVAAVTQLFERISHLIEEASIVLENSFKSVTDSIEKELIPHAKELSSKLLNTTKDVLEIVLNMALGILAKVTQLLEKYQPEMQELATTFGELFHDVGKLLYKVYENSFQNVKRVIQKIISEVEASPHLERLKTEYNQLMNQILPTADAIINPIREICNTAKDVIPQDFAIKEDINVLLDSIVNYIEKKLKNKEVDDIQTLEQISRSIVVIAKKLISLVGNENFKLSGSSRIDSGNLVPLSYWRNLPRLAAVKFSPLNYILDPHISDEIWKFLLSLVNSPRNLVPPFPLFGLIIQGQHIFTFDGNHITFPGKCNYLLARDALNGNFTVAGSYKDGLLTGITLTDEHGSLTLQQGGKVKADQESVELPYRKPTIAAFRTYETITLITTAGALVECTPDLMGCVVRVSGFYHNQVRGLLGNGNYEPFDDFTLPNGKIVTAEGQFTNSYKLAASCPDVTVPKHDGAHDNPTCNKLFSWESPLRVCYPFVPVDNFKAACAHGLAANVKETQEAITKAYVAACQDRNIPVHVPESLVKCTNGDKPYSVGDQFSVKLPSKAADVVIIVESRPKNQQLYDKLVKILIPELTNELHNKGIRDIEYHLLTYGGDSQWPSHVTVNGKLTFKNKPPALKFSEDPVDQFDTKLIQNPTAQKAAEELKNVIHDLRLASGLNLKTETYNEALNYPFRVHALKTVVVVNADSCEVGKLYPLQKALSFIFKNTQITLNLFTPVRSLSVKDAKKVMDIVGFNSHNVFTLSHGKKNPKGSPEMYKDLSYDDYCIDFTVNDNRGNTFVNENFLALSEADQKQFVHIAVANIAEELVNVEQGLDCECKLTNPWHAQNVCKVAYSKERSSKKV